MKSSPIVPRMSIYAHAGNINLAIEVLENKHNGSHCCTISVDGATPMAAIVTTYYDSTHALCYQVANDAMKWDIPDSAVWALLYHL
jgi:hypothetical protein